MKKHMITKILILSLMVGVLCQWSGESNAKAASTKWLFGSVLTKSQGGGKRMPD